MCADRIVANRHDCIVKIFCSACGDLLAVAECATTSGCVVLQAEKRCADDADHWSVAVQECKGNSAQRKTMDKIRGSVDRVERPYVLGVKIFHRIGTCLLT